MFFRYRLLRMAGHKEKYEEWRSNHLQQLADSRNTGLTQIFQEAGSFLEDDYLEY